MAQDNVKSESFNIGIIDCGCPSNVMGKIWLHVFEESLEGKKLKRTKCHESFKFGPSSIYTADEKVTIPIKLGQHTTEITVAVVDCDIPLLISGNQMEIWKVNQDYENRILKIGVK